MGFDWSKKGELEPLYSSICLNFMAHTAKIKQAAPTPVPI